MVGWLIFGVIVVLLSMLMLIRLRLVIESDDNLILSLKVLWLTFHIFPSSKQMKKIHLRDYEIKRVRKMKEKARKKQRKLMLKAERKKSSQNFSEDSAETNEEKSDVIGIIKLVFAVLKDVQSTVIGYIGLDLERIYIVVSSEDAANTAILYGAVAQSVNFLLEFLRNMTGFRITGKEKDIAIVPDFGFGRTTVRLKLIVHIRIWQLIVLAARGIWSFWKYHMKNI